MSKTFKERQKIQNKIRKLANALRNRVNGETLPKYFMTLMFYRYLSETFANSINKTLPANEPRWEKTDEEAIKARYNDPEFFDREENLKRLSHMGFFLKPSDLFVNLANVSENEQTDKLHYRLRKILDYIEASSEANVHSWDDFKGLFDGIDPNNNDLGSEDEEKSITLQKFIHEVKEFSLDLDKVSVDPFGEIYEHLMFFFANMGGKTGGEFFTPQEVSELLVGLTTIDKKQDITVYDPACGTGSLLINFVKKLGKDHIDMLFGQELNPNTYNLCRMNMFIHGLDYDKFSIKVGDTLVSKFGHKDFYDKDNKEFKVDIVVSNPPYSKEWTPVEEERFRPTGKDLPKKPADYAFILHGLSCLKDDGVAAFVCPFGVLYREGVEGSIRKYLIEQNLVDAVILLPNKIFTNTTIPTCIILFKKQRDNTDILFIDASREFEKFGKLNYITGSDFNPEQNHVKNILGYYNDRKSVKGLSYVATLDEIKENDYVLLVDNYVTPIADLESSIANLNINQLNSELASLAQENQQILENINDFVEFFNNNKK